MTARRLLLVEDDPDIAESLRVTLEMHGFEVTAYPSGQGVYEYVRDHRPDLVIMDVMMPPPDGMTVCRTLKSDDRTKAIPVILLSARAQKSEVDLGFSAGADRYLAKPFINEDLLKIVDTLLERS